MRSELRRLDREYPTKIPKVIEWLAVRMGLAEDAEEAADPNFRPRLMIPHSPGALPFTSLHLLQRPGNVVIH